MTLENAGPRFPRPLVVTMGAMKAGTSSLHAWMDRHPELAMSRTKELNYFTHAKPPLGGMARYRASFPRAGRIAGESSVNYSKHPLFPGVPERMAAEVPRARLIYVLRDPIDRLLSHYRHNVSHGRERRDIRTALQDFAKNNYVATSRYHEQLQRFLVHYDRAQILIVDFDSFRHDVDAAMARIFTFLGVDASFRDPSFGQVHHASSAKGKPNKLGAPIANVPYLRHLRYALPQVFEEPLERPVLPDDLRSRLEEHFAPEVEAMRASFGWPGPSSG